MQKYLISLFFLTSLFVVNACGDEGLGEKEQASMPPAPAPLEEPREDPQATPQDSDNSTFSLTLPEDNLNKSQFCKKAIDEIPEDPTPPHRFDLSLINQKLTTEGLNGWIHGAVPSFNHYTFTYRKEDPEDFMAFFKAEQFAVVSKSPVVISQLRSLNRHDRVKLFGVVIEGKSALRHIMVNKIEILKRYESATRNTYEVDSKMLEVTEPFKIFGKVHATVVDAEKGGAIVVEHKKMMIPIIVPKLWAKETRELFRNDIIEIEAQWQRHENRPPHLVTVNEKSLPWRMIDRMVDCHGEERTLEGYLVYFKKSPAISTDVYAVRVVDANGIGRNFTFFPDAAGSEFMALFNKIKEKTAARWNAYNGTKDVLRNYRKAEGLKVKVTGRLNVVSLEQANPQIYIKSVDDLTIFTESNSIAEENASVTSPQ